MRTKLLLMFTALAMMLGAEGCGNNPEITVNSKDFEFKAVNLSLGEGQLSASSGSAVVTVNWTVNVIVNGETTTVSGTGRSDELPVRPGDEIEVRFTPSSPAQKDAFFTLPDGMTQKATTSSPVFRWTVPADFVPGMKIQGESRYESDDCIYNRSGSITLVSLK